MTLHSKVECQSHFLSSLKIDNFRSWFLYKCDLRIYTAKTHYESKNYDIILIVAQMLMQRVTPHSLDLVSDPVFNYIDKPCLGLLIEQETRELLKCRKYEYYQDILFSSALENT